MSIKVSSQKQPTPNILGGSVLQKQKAFGPIVQFFGVTVGLEKILAWNN